MNPGLPLNCGTGAWHRVSAENRVGDDGQVASPNGGIFDLRNKQTRLVMTTPSDSEQVHDPEVGSKPIPVPSEGAPLIVCGGCGCWCDDIEVDHDGTLFRNACSLGSQYLARQGIHTSESSNPQDDSSRERLLQELVERFLAANRPLITGLSWSSLETIRLAVAVADRIRGVIDPWQSEQQVGKLIAFQQSGDVSATWGEVKHRADVVIYWRCQPQHSPRFRHRYGDLSDGALLNGARRQVFVLDSKPDRNAWTKEANSNEVDLHMIDLGESVSDLETLQVLLRATRGCQSKDSPGADRAMVKTSPGETSLTAGRWDFFLSTVLTGKSIAIVVGDLDAGVEADAIQLAAGYQLLNRWVVGLNEGRRAFTVPFAKDAQQGGLAQTVLAWRTGYPMAVDFSRGFPQYDAETFRWAELVAGQDVDFVLLIGGEMGTMSKSGVLADSYAVLNRFASQNPVFEIGVKQSCQDAVGFVQTARDSTYWKGRPQTKARPDGILLPFRNLPRGGSQLPTEPEVLQELYSRIVANSKSEVANRR